MPSREDLDVDRLAAAADAQVAWVEAFAVDTPRAPHRHDYHELLLVRSGEGEQELDGVASPVRANTVTVVRRGQVHVFARAHELRGAIVRWRDEAVDRPAPLPGVVDADPAEVDAFAAVVGALAAELGAPDRSGVELQRALLAAVLLYVERWRGNAVDPAACASQGERALHRRFVEQLERDFARRHAARHYADALGVPPAALARALRAVTGRSTKELVLDRVLAEGARLLRFTDRSVGEIAFAVGYRDQLYFSRAFRRRYGMAPSAYRDQLRG